MNDKERIAELEAELAAAERNIGVLQKQLANCHETMRKDGVQHAKLLLVVEDDQAKAARLRETLLLIMREWNRDVEYATVPTLAWKQAEDVLGQKISPRDLKKLLAGMAERASESGADES